MHTLFDRPQAWANSQATTRAGASCHTDSDSMTREQVLDRIITINPTASRSFLDSFERDSLGTYLKRLQHATAPRGPKSRPWQRTGGAAAISAWRIEY